ncbi:MAG: hypothetical protein IJQ16_03405, partial [Selenomonadaceae bacterium]|nr:hypothetical protein [Selenomonadaceae bacterium]
IYFCGNCVVYGVNAPFDKTISSYLQKMLNEHNLPYRVENASQTYFQRRQDMFYNLVKLNPKPDDIIFFFTHFSSKLPCINLGNAFDGYDPRKIWANQGHPNEIGYKILAEKFFNLLTQHNFFKDIQFNYQAPPPRSSLRHSERKLSIPCNKTFRQRRIGGTQKNFARTAA